MEGHTKVISTALSDARLIGQGEGGVVDVLHICVRSRSLPVAYNLIAEDVFFHAL